MTSTSHDNRPTNRVEPQPSPLLLLLGQGSDTASERGVDCPGALPSPSDPDLIERATAAKAALGDRVFVLGHHYQRDEVIQFADVTGDSFKLAREAAARPQAEFIVFCGVHFMAASADILTADHQSVVLPDLAAGCSMADMAGIDQVESAWRTLADAGLADSTIPVTYMNSSAAIKAFTGRNGGTVCTSSNAETSLRWAFESADRVLFLPDQHLGRNTAVMQLGMSLDDCVVFDPRKPGGGVSAEQLRDARMILWRGHCSVHGRFTAESVDEIRDLREKNRELETAYRALQAVQAQIIEKERLERELQLAVPRPDRRQTDRQTSDRDQPDNPPKMLPRGFWSLRHNGRFVRGR